MPARRRGEFALVAELLAPLGRGDPRALGFADDAAVLPPEAGRDLVVATDTAVAGVHHPEGEAGGVAARRLLRANLSDLAAMGASPDGYFLNLSLPDEVGDGWLEAFADGLRRDQERFGATLLGGDTTRTPGPLTATITVVGTVPAGGALTRAGAAPGDVAMVSGTIGDAALGLAEILEGRGGGLAGRFRLPEPRLALGERLRGIATAAADVSDGLVADLGHVCAASGVAVRIEAAAVPLSAGAAAALAAGEADLAALLAGGDDHELVFAVPPGREAAALAAGRRAGVAVARIGVFRAGAGDVEVAGPDGRPMALERRGWRHF